MANRYDTNLILDRIADALDDDQNSALITSLEDIKTAIENGGGGGGGGGGDPHNEMIATEFSPASTYAFGDYCIHNDTYYKCINAINTPGAWDITDWQVTNVGNELSALNSKITGLIKTVTLTKTPLSTNNKYIDTGLPYSYKIISIVPTDREGWAFVPVKYVTLVPNTWLIQASTAGTLSGTYHLSISYIE